MEAIRLALQRTMQQVVVVDRLIKDDKIVTDKIYSTLNGYVENFKELEIRQQAMRASLSVTPTPVTSTTALSPTA